MPNASAPLAWRPVATTPLATTRIFSLSSVRKERTDGLQATFAVLDCPDWVNVVALTPEDELLFIEQFRQGTDAITLEIPGGMVDPGESPRDAAVRELLEETGYRCASCEPIGVVEPNPAIQNNRCHTFLALGCVRHETASFDPSDTTEECVLRLEPAAHAAKLVQRGAITHALVVAALYHALLSGALPHPSPTVCPTAAT